MFAQILDTPKKRIVVAAVALAVLAGSIAVFALGGEAEEAAPATTTTTTTTTTAPPTTTTAVPVPVAPLTGLPGDGDRLSRPAVFVKIDNAPQARPQSGLVQADIVFEERVEGNTARLVAVFHSTDAVEIGPVRSTRSTDLQMVSLFGRPIYASSGGNGGILAKLGGANVVDVGHNVNGGGFRRASGRPAPHNLFTSLPELYAKAPEQPPAPPPLFAYREPGVELPTPGQPVGGVALSFGAAEVSRFQWDPPAKRWVRFHGSQPHVDPAGKQVAPENVVVLEIGYDFSGGNGNSVPHGVLTGEGRALVFTEGHVIEGRWVRPTLDHPLQVLSPANTPIVLTPGQTFVELVPPGGARIL